MYSCTNTAVKQEETIRSRHLIFLFLLASFLKYFIFFDASNPVKVAVVQLLTAGEMSPAEELAGLPSAWIFFRTSLLQLRYTVHAVFLTIAACYVSNHMQRVTCYELTWSPTPP